MHNYLRSNTASFFYQLILHVFSGPTWFLFLALLAGGVMYGLVLTNVIIMSPFLIVVSIVMLIMLRALLMAGLAYSNLKVAIEEHSLKISEGILSLQTHTIPFSKITNAVFDQNLSQRVFGLGNLIIDQEDAELEIENIDKGLSDRIISAISEKSNIQNILQKNN